MRARRTLAALALVLTTASACSGASEGEVASDAKASAADIVEAGRPGDVAVAGDSSLILYGVFAEDDEGPAQYAWRVYDGDGGRIGEGKLARSELGPDVIGVDDGFLIADSHAGRYVLVDRTGTSRPVPAPAERVPTRAGDVPLWAFEGTPAFYRPAEHRTYLLPELPASTQSVALGEDGTVWAHAPADELGLEPGVSQLLSARPGRSWKRELVRLGDEKAFPYFELTAGDGRVLFSTYVGQPERPRTVGVMSRAADGQWTQIAPPDGARVSEPDLRLTASGGLLLIDQGAWLRAGDSWRQLDLPGKDDMTTVVVAGERIYALSYDDFRTHVSTDDGKTWKEVPR